MFFLRVKSEQKDNNFSVKIFIEISITNITERTLKQTISIHQTTATGSINICVNSNTVGSEVRSYSSFSMSLGMPASRARAERSKLVWRGSSSPSRLGVEACNLSRMEEEKELMSSTWLVGTGTSSVYVLPWALDVWCSPAGAIEELAIAGMLANLC